MSNASHGALTFSPDGRRLFLGGCQSLAVLDTADGAVVGELEVAGAPITSLAVAAEPGRLLVANKHGALSVEWASGEQRVLFPK